MIGSKIENIERIIEVLFCVKCTKYVAYNMFHVPKNARIQFTSGFKFVRIQNLCFRLRVILFVFENINYTLEHGES